MSKQLTEAALRDFAKEVWAALSFAGLRNPGRDCVAQAVALSELLRADGYAATAEIGVAAFRTGSRPQDVVAHHELMRVVPTGGTFMGHAWVELGGMIIDTTVCDIPMKMQRMNAVDGLDGECWWSGDILWKPRNASRSFEAVERGTRPGIFHYETREQHQHRLHEERIRLQAMSAVTGVFLAA